MTSRWREIVERFLPWFDAQAEHARDRRTETIRKRSIVARLRAERVIEEYRAAEAVSDAHAERLIKEVRRDGR